MTLSPPDMVSPAQPPSGDHFLAVVLLTLVAELVFCVLLAIAAPAAGL